MAVISKERIAEAVVGGVVGFVVVATYSVVRAWAPGTSDGDWLEFAGAIFGVLGAILVALAIPWVHSAAQDRRARSHIRSAAADLIDTLDFDEVQAAEAEGRWVRVLVGAERLAFERTRMTKITHDQFVRLRGIERALELMDAGIKANPDLLDPLTFEVAMGEARNGVVVWLREVETLFAD